jgi:hypothetical protein
MIKHGTAPFLECSSRGDKRFSAFYAYPKSLKGKSIEEAYQAAKLIKMPNGDLKSGLHWKEAKGKPCVNINEAQFLYKEWWKEWVKEQNLLPILKSASGLSDMFGQQGHICQATVLWELRNIL